MDEKPRQLILAIRVMWALLGLGLLMFISSFSLGLLSGAIPLKQLLLMATVYCITYGLFGYLIFSISKGKNWARITITIVACISVLLKAKFLYSMHPLHRTPSVLIVSLVFLAIIVMILWLLFHRDSNAWFVRA